MGFADAVKTCLRKYITVSGRASRSEYWWFVLFYNLAVLAGFIVVVITLDENGENGSGLPLIGALIAFLPPMIAVTARRLHDKGLTAWIILISFVPFGSLALLILCALAGDEGENSYGPPPFAGKASENYAKSNIPHVRDKD